MHWWWLQRILSSAKTVSRDVTSIKRWSRARHALHRLEKWWYTNFNQRRCSLRWLSAIWSCFSSLQLCSYLVWMGSGLNSPRMWTKFRKANRVHRAGTLALFSQLRKNQPRRFQWRSCWAFFSYEKYIVWREKS